MAAFIASRPNRHKALLDAAQAACALHSMYEQRIQARGSASQDCEQPCELRSSTTLAGGHP